MTFKPIVETKFRGTVFGLSLLTLLLGMVIAVPALATNHAIIVGVSKYQNLDESLWLNGPKNDARLVRDYLTSQAVAPFAAENVSVLADGVDGADEPTLSGIRTAFKNLQQKVAPGDFVYLHFSGHGSQAPAKNPEQELDGLDELFLPADIGPWNDSIGQVTNALVDDEIGYLINGLRKRGTSVWAVFDSCHSGTVTRGMGKQNALDEEVSRKLDPAILGLSNSVLSKLEKVQMRGNGTAGAAAPESGSLVRGEVEEGIFVAFYAAQSNQTTPEMRLPAGDPDRISHGLFTFTLLETMAQNPSLNYRQLGQEILRRYSVEYRVQPTPLFEGDLDAMVLSSDSSDRIQQWPLIDSMTGFSIAGGKLHGLSRDEKLIVVPGPAADSQEQISMLKVSQLGDLSAQLESATDEFLTFDTGVYVRKQGRSVNFELTVAGLGSSQDTASADAAFAAAIENSLTKLDPAVLRVNLVASNDEADIRLAIADEQLWLTGPGGRLVKNGAEKTPSIRLPGRSAEQVSSLLIENLTRMSRAINLLKLGGAYSAGGFDAELKLKVRSKRNPAFTYLESASVSDVFPGDEMHIEVSNKAANPIDINLLYVGSDYSISFIRNARINSAETLRKKLGRFSDRSFGRERLIMVSTVAEPQSAVEDLSWLAQGGIEQTRSNQKPTSLARALNTAGFGTALRSFIVEDDESDTASSISQVEFRIQRLQ
ncbi:MAG: caspase family protein [Rhizobiaceae bacterium]